MKKRDHLSVNLSGKKLTRITVCLIIATLVGTSFAFGCGPGRDREPTPEPAPPSAEELPPVEEPPPTEEPAPAVNPAEPPQLPPASSFIIDFSDFLSPDNSSFNPGAAEPDLQYVSFTPNGDDLPTPDPAQGDQQNWGFAALNVGFWNALLFVGLVIPVAAFVESFNHSPEQQPDYTWVWSYDVPVNNVVYTAELHGRFIDNGVRWEMYLSKEGEYSDFQWYYGESDLPATEGFWILKNNPTDPTDLLRIDWHRDIADGTSDISYTNIVPGGPENGGYILYEVTTETPNDRKYEIFNKGKDNTTYIEWDSMTDAGGVKDEQHFSDSEWHCWDDEHRDSECP
jgi:hypothetical protein